MTGNVTRRSTGKARTLARRAAAVLFGLLAGCALAEWMFWARDHGAYPHLNVYVADSELGVRLEPNATTQVAFGGSAVSTVFIHGGGFRGPSAGAEAPVRDDEVLFLGDSQTFGLGVRERVEAYRAALDPRIGTVYDRRRLFEESVTRIADGISSYLDLEEQTAQAMFPHYFEKQKTDGVDHQIYVGASLLEDGRFDPLYLKSLRLWQLMVTCGVALRVNRLKEKLPVPLEVTHLVLVQHSPLSIRFRFDEKRFDVDGAYDIRYEIVKKRIDKAVIKGTDERITQPGKIAIIYSHSSEAYEYRGYIEYLQSRGYLTGEVEDAELDELQGVHGLRALRVTIDLRNPRIDRRIALADLQPATGAASRN